MDLLKRIQDLSAIYDDDGPSSTVQESRPMFNDGGMLVQPSDDGSRPGYAKNKMSGSKEQQAGNLAKKENRLSKIGELFINKDYKKLKVKTRKARMGKGSIDAGGVLNAQDKTMLNNIIYDGTVKEQNALAKELGINRRYMIEVYTESEKLKNEGKALQQSKAKLAQVQNQKKIFDEILNNKNATVESMAKKFKMTEKEITKESSKLLKNVYTQNVAIGKGPEFDINSRGQKTLKSWLPDNFETTDSFLDNFSNIKGLKNVQSENMSILIKNAYGDNPKKFTEAMKGLSEYNKFVNTLPEGLKLDLDHPLSKAFLKGSGVSPDKLLYVTPIDRSYNRGFKQTISMAYDKALLSGDKQKIKTIEKFAKDIEINIGKGSGSKFDFGTSALGKKTQENLREEVLSNLREQNRTGELLSKYRKTKEGKDTIKSIFTSNRAELKIKKIDKKIIQNIQSYSKLPQCRIDKAGGGRIGFAYSDECIRDGLKEQKIEAQKGNKKAAQELVQVGKAATRAGLLKNLLGPGAILGEAVYEGAVIGNKVLGGKELDQAWAESYLSYLDPRKYTPEGLDSLKMSRDAMTTRKINDRTIDGPNANILRSGFAAQDQVAAFNEAINKRERAKKAGRLDQYSPAAADAREQGRFVDQSKDIISSDSFQEATKQAKEYIANQEAQNRFNLGIFGTPQGELSDDRRRYKANKAMNELFKPITRKDVDKVLRANNGYTPYAFGYGMTNEGKYNEDLGYKQIIDEMDKGRKQSYFADNFRTEKAGGGIAKMAGDRSGPPPQSGPNSQGLQGLFNRAMKIKE
jgi:hypothetical protein